MKKDTIFSEKMSEVKEFTFDAKVVDVFPDMINRSVPGYKSIIDFSGITAMNFVKPDTICYDLGCSLGASSLSIANHVNHFDYKIVAIDNSEEMTERLNKIIQRQVVSVPIEVICSDIKDIKLINSSFVVMNFTLQFIDPKEREDIIKNIYNGLNKGGALFLSEKICFEDESEQNLIEDLHYSFKRFNGYSELEISQKRNALDNVLIADKIEDHLNRFKKCGFSKSMLWFQCLNFVSFLAVK